MYRMYNTVEKVIEMPQLTKEHDSSQIVNVVYEIIDMIFEMFISFVPIILYWLIFYFAGDKVDFYEHVKNGSIIWIFLAMLVAGNFKLLVSEHRESGLVQRMIIAAIIIFMLFLLGVYLMLNFSTYGVLNITLVEDVITLFVIFMGISTIVLNILRIVFF